MLAECRRTSVCVVIPVGPGHGWFARQAAESVHRAWQKNQGPFSDLEISLVDDHLGELGRSAARNQGIRQSSADWYFLLDADDTMQPKAFGRVRLDQPATFGAIHMDRRPAKFHVEHVTRETLFRLGVQGTLAMGCFVRGDVARSTPFDESMDIAEDYDFYMRLPGFVKIREPLVDIGFSKPSATGPRGRKSKIWRPGSGERDWNEACREVIERYRRREFGLVEHIGIKPDSLIECSSVLDIGAGLRPFQWYVPRRHICIEPHEPYAMRLSAAGYEAHVMTAIDGLHRFEAEAVYLLDVIEHMDKAEALEVIKLALDRASVQVVISTPLGFMEQTEDRWGLGGEYWQTHRSGWVPDEFTGWDIQPDDSEGYEMFYAVKRIAG